MKQPKSEKTISMDDPALLLGATAFVYLGCWAAWSFGHEHISEVLVYFRYLELSFLHAMGQYIDVPGVSHARDWINMYCAPERVFGLCQRDFYTISWDELSSATVSVNALFVIAIVTICVRNFFRVNKTHPKIRYLKKHDLKSFVNENKGLYPHLVFFDAIDLIDQPIDHPVFGMSLTSRQFSYKYKLIAGWRDIGDELWKPTIDREESHRVFRAQLGKLWTKSTDLSIAETLLLAIAIPRVVATDDRLSDTEFKSAMKDSDDVILWAWQQFIPSSNDLSWLHPEIDVTFPRSIINKYIKHQFMVSLLQSHAYVKTVLMAVFFQARRLGVLPPCEMRWLRFYDRELWYALQTFGRLAPFPEAAAVHGHYLYEAKSRTALVEPQLDKAINALEAAVNGYKYQAIDKKGYEELNAK